MKEMLGILLFDLYLASIRSSLMQLLNTQFMSFSQQQQLLIQKTQLLLNPFTRRQLKNDDEGK